MPSFLDEMRTARQRILDTSTRDLAVPGTGGRVWVRYKAPDRDRLDDVVNASLVGEALSKDQELQLLVDCCEQIMRPDGNDGLEPFDPDSGPLRFDGGDERWGPDVKSARDCVAKLFNLDHQPLAATGHAQTLIGWLQGIERELEARVEEAGKARAGEPS